MEHLNTTPLLRNNQYKHTHTNVHTCTHTHTHTRVCACSGDPLANLSLAQCYSQGRGVDQSLEEAFRQHLLASDKGTCTVQ